MGAVIIAATQARVRALKEETDRAVARGLEQMAAAEATAAHKQLAPGGAGAPLAGQRRPRPRVGGGQPRGRDAVPPRAASLCPRDGKAIAAVNANLFSPALYL